MAQRVQTAQQAMKAAQEAANAESKSSAGDKYETTRALMQIERDRHAAQLVEALKLQKELESLAWEQTTSTARAGSLVSTNQGHFFIAVSIGKITLDGTDYFAISTASLIGSQLLNRKAGDEFQFQNKLFQIQEIV